MKSLNITLPDAIAQALSAYMRDRQAPVDAVVETALETFLVEQGYLSTPESAEEPLESAVEGFRQGWHDAMAGKTIPIAQLWDSIDVE